MMMQGRLPGGWVCGRVMIVHATGGGCTDGGAAPSDFFRAAERLPACTIDFCNSSYTVESRLITTPACPSAKSTAAPKTASLLGAATCARVRATRSSGSAGA